MPLSRPIVFIADWVEPRLGIPKALESLMARLPTDQIELVLISGPPPVDADHPVTTLEQPRGWRGRLRAFRQLRRVARERSEAGAVLVGVGSWAFAALAAASIFSPFKLTLWEHSILPWRIRNEFAVTVVAIAVRLLAFRLERVVCVSESNRAAIAPLTWPLKKLTVIPNITDIVDNTEKPDIIRGPDSDDVISLVGIGSLTQRKNWALAVRAMQHLPQNYQLEVAGDGPERERLSLLIDELGLRDRVRLLGYVPHADRLINNAHVVVHPSFAETFGYTMVEASAMCRPVVVLDMPVMNEMVPSFACGECSQATPTEFASAIIRASSKTYDYPKAARARKKYFSEGTVLNSWGSLIPGARR
ncbi:glycosyltransferase [Candidatus Mycolicibacterium alkanivorans]|uniref:Glycosyltransferase n=1 Tax=Candidatus Mycolicibacterium alkanivorans TaxID=2954114 RepID=A0ABS9YRI3_9MYCO|nr:glycosyltransferase [Candidatus Mycolicibacterium alkanivorans]MCI4673459.1 glycosyltransferase [Candidatus Mycolicibacterium alkanivorans]